jgi:hypothetical protein
MVELTNDMLIADLLMRVKCIENLLIAKGVFSKEELLAEMEVVAKQIAKSVLEKAGVSNENVENLLQVFSQNKPTGN